MNATQLVLNNLFYLTCKLSDECARELELIWAILASASHANVKIIVRYVFVMLSLAPYDMLRHGKSVVCCMARASPQHVIDELLGELELMDSLASALDRCESALPFYRYNRQVLATSLPAKATQSQQHQQQQPTMTTSPSTNHPHKSNRNKDMNKKNKNKKKNAAVYFINPGSQTDVHENGDQWSDIDDQDQEDSASSDSNSDASSSSSSSSASASTSGDSSSSNSSSRSSSRSSSVVDVEAKLGRPERKANKNDNNRAHNENDEKGDDDHEDEDEDELFVSGGETGSRGSAHRQPPHGSSYTEASKRLLIEAVAAAATAGAPTVTTTTSQQQSHVSTNRLAMFIKYNIVTYLS